MSDVFKTIIADSNDYSDEDFEKKIPRLTFLTSAQVGRRIMLADDRVTLGRSPEATIMLRDKQVSRLHLAIDYDSKKNIYHIKDLNSSNGTLLNGSHVSSAALKESDKIIIGATVLRFGWADVLDLQYQTEIDHLMNIDGLTGLVVKRRFEEEMNRYVAVAKKQDRDLAMMMMDLDGVKQINDTYGHSYGEYTIAQTGKLIKAVIDQIGMASRFGGDEFMAFIPDTRADEVHRIAEEIRQKVETHRFEKDGISLRPTISIGVSGFQSDDNMASLFKRADKALYLSKNMGRNRVSMAT
jgi:diguanylate cyclase (GGDEF)-like protein